MAAGLATLAFDIGGTGLKAIVLGPRGAELCERARIDTTYPLPPHEMVAKLASLTEGLPAFDRISAGFPGVVRDGHIRTAPHFITTKGPGTKVDPKLAEAWADFDLAGALTTALGKPTRVANDADVQGLGAIAGKGLELVITLGTGMGSAVFRDGAIALHLELAHHPGHKGETYNEWLGEAARKAEGPKAWRKRVAAAIVQLDSLICPDIILVGGGNSERVKAEDLTKGVHAEIKIIGNEGGLLGGIKLWAKPIH